MSCTKIRPQSPVSVSWFEFLLNPSLLERHLAQENSDPPALQLIISFLSNCTTFTSDPIANGVKTVQQALIGPLNYAEEIEPDVFELKAEEEESKKNQALKLLALKVAAVLKWHVSLFEQKLPLPMQQTLLTSLMKIHNNEIKPSIIAPKKDANRDSEFARMLYCTWVLHAAVEGSYPSKNHKQFNVQIPGQIDPLYVPQAVIDVLMRKLYDEADAAAVALEEYIQYKSKLRMPLLISFGSITDENLTAVHKWELGLILREEETVCQVSYALGRFYFFQEKYEQASRHFIKAVELFPKLRNPAFCHVDEVNLQGFYTACANLLGYQKPSPSTPLKDTLYCLARSGHQDTVQILRSDNIKRELPLSLRDTTEITLLHQYSNKMDMLIYVTFANALRRAIDGEIVICDWLLFLKTNEEKCSLIFCELLKEVVPHCNHLQKSYLKNVVGLMCLASIPARMLLKKFEVLNMLYNNKEMDDLLNLGQQMPKRDTLKLSKSFTDNTSVQVGLLERKLILAEDVTSIKLVVAQLRGNYGLADVCSLNKNWELPRPVAIFLKNTPAQVDQEMIQLLLAKSNELRAIRNFTDARHLCLSVENEIRNCNPRLQRYMSWELLRLDLLEIMDAPVCQPSPYRLELVQRIFSFLGCYRDREFAPDLSLFELCAAVLLNFREWDKIIEVGANLGSYFEFSRMVAIVCKDIFVTKANRNTCRDLWDIVLPIFSNNHMKRTVTGIIKDAPREFVNAVMNKTALQQFIKKLKDTSSLGVIISCLSKFYNILKDDSVGEIFLEYQGLWPATVTNAAMFNMMSVSEAFQGALQHALTVHPTHSAWLRAKGDVMYVQGHYSTALKYYMSAAAVSTDYFYLPLPKVLFDDLMFKHMIHCCTKLHNHTQAATLHQFLEEINYPGAFKALGERVCNDNCDSYYHCIWDVTLLEYLINMHSRRGELEYRNLVMQLIGQLELNSNNNEEIQREAANLRKGIFLRAMAKQFL